jgi:hypothetical protein
LTDERVPSVGFGIEADKRKVNIDPQSSHDPQFIFIEV